MGGWHRPLVYHFSMVQYVHISEFVQKKDLENMQYTNHKSFDSGRRPF